MALSTERSRAAPHDHVVQFYGHDDELAEGVSRYLAETIESDGVAIVIATATHRQAFAAGLAGAGFDVALAQASGALLMLDAAEAMASLLVDGRLAPHRFDKLIGDVVRDAAGSGRPVGAFGEIVALMWSDGHVAAALELEELWNDLGQETAFSLYCAYPLASVEGEGDIDAFHEVCHQHSAVVGAPVALPRLQDSPLELVRSFIWSGHGPADARRFVTHTLVSWGHTDLVDDAAVVTTELATNAVLHAGTDFTVTVSRRPDGAIRVAVRDASLVP
ncbi:MAG TPA: MEDS domain-containing protein, partial [Acidimicrobiia bacterium]|nr:MEDS domain-containing protein [Acidimicrobiia bacterium]